VARITLGRQYRANLRFKEGEVRRLSPQAGAQYKRNRD
jgi:hypothetical protein